MCEGFLCLAVWTRLELATPCVTGMYSNQTELPDRLHHDFKDLFFFSNAGAKVRLFFQSAKKKMNFPTSTITIYIYIKILRNNFFMQIRLSEPCKITFLGSLFPKFDPLFLSLFHSNMGH